MELLLLRMLWMGASAVALLAPWPAPAHGEPRAIGWQAPVAGHLLRPFEPGPDPFARGRHRGIDLAARPGDPVRAACTGRVAFAGDVAGSRVVTVACGPWRVTHLPLQDVTVAGGAHVNRGRRIGSVGAAAGHAGLHVGVRRASRRFGYVDPWPLLRRSPIADPPGVIPAPRRIPLRPLRPPPLRLRAVRLRPVRPAEPESPRLAPPVAWAGLALLLAGVARARRLPRARPTRGHASRSAGAAARMGSAPPGRAGPPPRPAPRSASGRL